jgi:integrase
LVRGTKGGRIREVRIDPKHSKFLEALKERGKRNSDGHIFRGRGSLGQRTERAVDEACRRLGIDDQGTHGFRRTFAQERYREYRGEGSTDKEARRRLTHDLGHGRIAVTYSYVGRDRDS